MNPPARANRPRALLKYLILSSILVIAAVAIVAGFAKPGHRLKVASVYASVPPKASQSAPPSKRKDLSFTGDAPWALSALPECFSQLSKTLGPKNFVLAHLPADLVMASPGSQLYYADCKLTVAGDSILVTRGGDRFRIPPISRVYFGKDRLALLRGGEGGLELRVYQTPAGGGPMKL